MAETLEHRCLSPWKGAAVGAVIVFIVQSVSWMALPFHRWTIREFKDAAPIVQAVEANAPGSGVYIVANDPKGQKAPTDPFLFVSYRKEGWGSMGVSMALDFMLLMLGAFLWTWILGKIPGLKLKDAALYGCFFGLAVGALGAMPNTVWWKFSCPFSLMYVADSTVAWTIASLALSRCYASACELPR